MNKKMTVLKVEEIDCKLMTRKKTGETLGYVKMLSTAAGIQNMLVWQETLPSGSRSSAPHSHTTKEEMLIVQKGVLSVKYGEEIFYVPEGSMVTFLPDDMPHVTINESSEDVIYLGIATNPKNDQVQYTE